MTIQSFSNLFEQVWSLKSETDEKVAIYRDLLDAQWAQESDPLEVGIQTIEHNRKAHASATETEKARLNRSLSEYLGSKFPSLTEGYISSEAQTLRDEIKALNQQAIDTIAVHHIQGSAFQDKLISLSSSVGAGIGAVTPAMLVSSIKYSHPALAAVGAIFGAPGVALLGAQFFGLVTASACAAVNTFIINEENGWNLNDNRELHEMLTNISQRTEDILAQSELVYDLMSSGSLS